jgi:hypothetical protein
MTMQVNSFHRYNPLALKIVLKIMPPQTFAWPDRALAKAEQAMKTNGGERRRGEPVECLAGFLVAAVGVDAADGGGVLADLFDQEWRAATRACLLNRPVP